MSNGLSQSEIDALLSQDSSASGTDGKAEGKATEGKAKSKAKAKNKTGGQAPAAKAAKETMNPKEVLSPQQIDAMGEIGNISMGTSATTLSTMLNRRVDITTPTVSVTTMKEIAEKYPLPFAAVQVEYTKGLKGTNILFLRVEDVKIITDLLMGGDGTNTDAELNDMHLSAISEVMNQMVGSSSTSLSQLVNLPIDISPPTAYAINLSEEVARAPFTDIDAPLVKTRFQMDVEGLIQSEIMQIMPVDFARQMVEGLLGGGAIAAAEVHTSSTAEETVAQARTVDAPQAPAPRTAQRPMEARPVRFGAFEPGEDRVQAVGENMELLMDVPLPVSVELGKSKKHIKEILDFNVGTIIVLDKMAGDMVDVVVNGKLIAKAEVVVIDENYGARITDIVTPAKRLNK